MSWSFDEFNPETDMAPEGGLAECTGEELELDREEEDVG
jgi:hypothetical protein